MTLSYVIAIVCGGVAALSLLAYIPRLVGWFGSVKPQRKLISTRQNKIALIIPARNESKTIGALLKSVEKQTYPKERFGLFTVVNDENDPTFDMTENKGGVCVVVKNQKCKGDALNGCIKHILSVCPDEYDAYLIVDADCVLDENFLTEMNDAMASGAKVIQGKRLVKNRLLNKCNSLVSDCNGMIWTIIDQLGNRFKSDRKITGMTIGTGIMLTADFIKSQNGWPYRQTLTEDIELMYDCAARGIETYYTEYALIYVEESPQLAATNSRRTRWMTGVEDSRRLYSRNFFKMPKTIKNLRNFYYTHALSIVYVYIGSLYVHSVLQLCLAVTLLLFGNPAWVYALGFSVASYFVIYVSFFFLTLACLISDRRYLKINFGRKILVLLTHPVFYMGYISIIFKALTHKNPKEWVCIERADFLAETGEGEKR